MKIKPKKITYEELFNANDPEYLKLWPNLKIRLIEYQKKRMPVDCLSCIFFKWDIVNEKVVAVCSLNSITFEFGKRAKECPLDKEQEEKKND